MTAIIIPFPARPRSPALPLMLAIYVFVPLAWLGFLAWAVEFIAARLA